MLPVEILYEDADVLVINKPAGLVVHPDGRTDEPTVVDWILKEYPEVRGVGDTLSVKDEGLKIKDSERSLDRSGIVHRLDRETSGALLIAKNQTAFARLKKQFQRQEVHKTYHAFVYGSVKNDEGVIDRPIARSRANPVLWSATRGRRGTEREAVTEYRVLARTNFASPVQISERFALGMQNLRGRARSQGLSLGTKNSPFSLLELRPRTGRTHQLRVHLKAINYPIVCDKLYAPNKECLPAAPNLPVRHTQTDTAQAGALGFSRLALHSRAISFTHPMSGKLIGVQAPYPGDFERARALFEIQNTNLES